MVLVAKKSFDKKWTFDLRYLVKLLFGAFFKKMQILFAEKSALFEES